MNLHFTVPGTPVPQGSPKIGRRGPKAVLLLDSAKLAVWRERVTFEARSAARRSGLPKIKGCYFDEPMVVHARFYFAAPKRQRWPGIHATKPDLDKLQRAIGDALEDAKIVSNDSRICAWPAVPGKMYGEPRAEIYVWTVREWIRKGGEWCE